MSKRFHNKKRNVGILYELLARKVSEGLVENNSELSSKAIKIIQENFTEGSVLLKEYRLFSALSKTYVDSDAVISRLLSEAKRGSGLFDRGLLEQEKSRLIKSINKTFNDEEFFNTRLSTYKQHATIQTLLSAWRNPDKYGMGKIAEYEQRVSNLLKERKDVEDLDTYKTSDVDSLALKLMVEKFNKKFKDLSLTQKSVVDSVLEENDEKTLLLLGAELARVKRSVKSLKNSESSEWLLKKVDKVATIIEAIDPGDTSEENLQRFMTLSHLSNVITEEG